MTNVKTTISISDARKRIFEIADEVQSPNKVYTLTADGKPKVVIMSAEEYESWVETLDVLRTFPDLEKEVTETDEAVRSGDYKNWVSLEEMIAKRPRSLAEKPKRKYGIHTKDQTKSRKESR
ncbi:MAG: type II toxin-antitoxin system Phd/YefM family antitoxin [bacterium]|nr:type II toxin-antitoxin system Phd/YefM family antitoxin [bacterium]